MTDPAFDSAARRSEPDKTGPMMPSSADRMNQPEWQAPAGTPPFSALGIYRSLSGESGMSAHLPSLGVHAKRYERLMQAVMHLRASIGRDDIRVLDVGPWWQTALLRRVDGLRVDTLGLGPTAPAIDRPRPGEQYYQQDLNKAVHEDYRSDLPQYDMVIMAEVLEHLPMAPTHLLRRIRRHVRPGGYLILTTPNGVALNKRFRMIRGRVPYTLISENPMYPSHFREYTVAELQSFAAATGFQPVSCRITDDWYWRYNPSLAAVSGARGLRNRFAIRIHEAVGATLPDSMKQSIVMVLTC